MKLEGRKLGILISAAPANRNFQHAIHLTERALDAGVQVFLYFIDDAVTAIDSQPVRKLKEGGARLYSCAYSLQKRNLPMSEGIIPAGLTILNDIIASTDRFVSFTA